MLPLNLSCSEGNHYKPSPELSQFLADRFQLTPRDFQLGLLCIKPIGDCIHKAQYKEIRSTVEVDGEFYQTKEFIFTHYEQNDDEGVFKLALSRYDFKKVKQVRISKSDILRCQRQALAKQQTTSKESVKSANKTLSLKHFQLDI